MAETSIQDRRRRLADHVARSALLATAALLAACNAGPVGPVTTAGPGGSSAGPGATSIPGTTAAGPGGGAQREPDVITGRVTTEAGAPVAGASIRIVGYTGGANLGQEIETVTTGTDGTYRYAVPRGLYETHAEGPLAFDGQTYLFNLDPVDGSCEQQLSDEGIVRDYVLRLSGLQTCLDGGINPDNYLFYHGAAVQLSSRLTSAAPHDVVEYRLEPIGALADGRPGTPLTVQRTVAALSNYAGPIDDTSYLYDIPLARYLVSAALLAPDGRRLPLLVSTDGAPAQSVEVGFEPRVVVGTLSQGYSSVLPTLTVQEGG